MQEIPLYTVTGSEVALSFTAVLNKSVPSRVEYEVAYVLQLRAIDFWRQDFSNLFRKAKTLLFFLSPFILVSLHVHPSVDLFVVIRSLLLANLSRKSLPPPLTFDPSAIGTLIIVNSFTIFPSYLK